jgi:hypothetical protein
MTGSVSDGDESVKADDGLHDATSIIPAPAMAATTPPLRREIIVISSGFFQATDDDTPSRLNRA